MLKYPFIITLWFTLSLAQVDTVWVRTIDGPGHYQDSACGIINDDRGNACVSGFVSVGSPSLFFKDILTVKYDFAGDPLWINTYNGPRNEDDCAVDLAVDTMGNIYVCGYSMGIDITNDYVTIKYDSSGSVIWIQRMNGPWGDNDYPTTLAVDDSGNVYVTGVTYAAWTEKDFMTIKYSSAGDTLWRRLYNHVDMDDYAHDIAVNTNGDVYVTGESYGLSTMRDYATVKYDSSGNILWTARYSSVNDDIPVAIVQDSDFCYVTGKSSGSGTDYDIVTVKYNSNGDTVWIRYYNGADNSDDYPTAMELDETTGCIYVTGCSRESTIDYCTIKYDMNGNMLWDVHYNGPGSSVDIAHALAFDDNGNIYVTGESRASNFDYATVKYDQNGNEKWVVRYNGAANSNDRAYGISVDSAGHVYVTGNSFGGASTNYDYLTIKYCQGTGIAESKSKTKTSNLLTMNSVFCDHLEIRISIPNKTSATLKVYDANGSLVKDLSSGAASSKIIIWDGRDNNNNILPPGIYFIHLVFGTEHISQKIIKVD